MKEQDKPIKELWIIAFGLLDLICKAQNQSQKKLLNKIAFDLSSIFDLYEDRMDPDLGFELSELSLFRVEGDSVPTLNSWRDGLWESIQRKGGLDRHDNFDWSSFQAAVKAVKNCPKHKKKKWQLALSELAQIAPSRGQIRSWRQPIFLRRATQIFLQSCWPRGKSSFSQVYADPGPFFVRNFAIFRAPEILADTVIQNPEDKMRYLITPVAAKNLAAGAEAVWSLQWPDRHKRRLTRQQIITFIRDGHYFDQLI